MDGIKKLRDYLEIWAESGKPFVRGLTPYMYNTLWYIHDSLEKGFKCTFIAMEICKALDKCGIKYQVCGIGWVAYI